MTKNTRAIILAGLGTVLLLISYFVLHSSMKTISEVLGALLVLFGFLEIFYQERASRQVVTTESSHTSTPTTQAATTTGMIVVIVLILILYCLAALYQLVIVGFMHIDNAQASVFDNIIIANFLFTPVLAIILIWRAMRAHRWDKALLFFALPFIIPIILLIIPWFR